MNDYAGSTCPLPCWKNSQDWANGFTSRLEIQPKTKTYKKKAALGAFCNPMPHEELVP
jgi:hypothetical protein